MAKSIKEVHNLETLLRYCTEKLDWNIDLECFDNPEDLVFDFDAEDLGIKEEEFASVNSFQELRPLVENQPWGIFCVDFESKKLDVGAMRKILNALIPRQKNLDHKTWECDNLLFLCFWGETSFRTIGFVSFHKEENTLPTLHTIYCTPAIESRDQIENFESRISIFKWPSSLDKETWINAWKKAFKTRSGQVIRNARALTESLAEEALTISLNLQHTYNVEDKNGTIHKLFSRFNHALNISLSVNDFTSMYAQTIVYGLFSARCMCSNVDTFNAKTAVENIPCTNPLLIELLTECCSSEGSMQFDELETNELVELLRVADIDNIIADFNRRTGFGKEDPIAIFYEDFLDIYEKEEKKRRGVYYTSAAIVDFIVKSIKEILKSEFNCDKGFLDDSLSILDPAVGTGTFLRRIILEAFDDFKSNSEITMGDWTKHVEESLLTRLTGFEFMMAPYAIAHLKLAMALKDTGYTFPQGQRLQVFLANSLMPNCDKKDAIDPLEKETVAAATARNHTINVVLGNPPYRTDSVNQGKWIMTLMQDFKCEPGTTERLNERNPKVVNDDYVKFIRLAEEIIKDKPKAIVAYIIPHGYLDNLTFRGMRWNVLHHFNKLYVLDLHGNAMGREVLDTQERDENVFDIQQGVCISFFIKDADIKSDQAEIYYADLCGSRKNKYTYLLQHSFSEINWKKVLPVAPYYFFKPKDLSNQAEYEQGVSLADLFPHHNGGVKTHHDAELISFTPFDTPYDQLYDYRPFDIRHINYDCNKVERNRYVTMKHMINHDNYGLVIDRQVFTDNWSHIQIVKNMIDNRLHYSRHGIPELCPMLLFNENDCVPNVSYELVRKFKEIISMDFSAVLVEQSDRFDVLDLFDYCYAVLNSSEYIEKYYEQLIIGFPRVPFPRNRDAFVNLVQAGAYLRKLHLLESHVDNKLEIRFLGRGDNVIKKISYKNERVFINNSQYFTNITNDIFEFCFAGYHGLNKWFKDRKGMRLTEEDISHVIKVYNIFNLTEEFTPRIDEILNEYEMI